MLNGINTSCDFVIYMYVFSWLF